jgi:hypothetical protein
MNSYFEAVFSERGWSSPTTTQFVITDPQISIAISPDPVFCQLHALVLQSDRSGAAAG